MKEEFIPLVPMSGTTYIGKHFGQELSVRDAAKFSAKLDQHLGAFGEDLIGAQKAAKSIIGDLFPEIVVDESTNNNGTTKSTALNESDLAFRCSFLEKWFDSTQTSGILLGLDPNKFKFDLLIEQLLAQPRRDDIDSATVAKLLYHIVLFVADIFSSTQIANLFRHSLSTLTHDDLDCPLDYALLKNASKNRKFPVWNEQFFVHAKNLTTTSPRMSFQFQHLYARLISEQNAANILKYSQEFCTDFDSNNRLLLKLFSLLLAHCQLSSSDCVKLIGTTVSNFNETNRSEEYFHVLNEYVSIIHRIYPIEGMELNENIYDLSDMLSGFKAKQWTSFKAKGAEQTKLYFRMCFTKYQLLQMFAYEEERKRELSRIVEHIIQTDAVRFDDQELLRALLPEAHFDDLVKLADFIVANLDSCASLMSDIELMSNAKLQTVVITAFIKHLYGEIAEEGAEGGVGETLRLLGRNSKLWYKQAEALPNPKDPKAEKVVATLRAATEKMFDDTVYSTGKASVGQIDQSKFWINFPIEYLTRLNQTRVLIVLAWQCNHICVHADQFSSTNEKSNKKLKKTKETANNQDLVDKFVDRYLNVSFRIWGGSRGVWFFEFIPADTFIVRCVEHYRTLNTILVSSTERVSRSFYTLFTMYFTLVYRHHQLPEERETTSRSLFRGLKSLADSWKNDVNNRKRTVEIVLPTNLANICLLLLQTQNGKFLAAQNAASAAASNNRAGRNAANSSSIDMKVFEKLEKKLTESNSALLAELTQKCATEEFSLPEASQNRPKLLSTFTLLALKEFFEFKLSSKRNATEPEVDSQEEYWLEQLDKLVGAMMTNISSIQMCQSQMDFLTFALRNRSKLSSSEVCTVTLVQHFLSLVGPSVETEVQEKSLRRLRRDNNWLKVYTDAGTNRKFYKTAQYLLPTGDDRELQNTLSESFAQARQLCKVSAGFFEQIAALSTPEEFEKIIQVLYSVLSEYDWTRTFYVLLLLNSMFAEGARIDTSRAEVIQRHFGQLFSRLVNIVLLASKQSQISTIQETIPRATIQVARSLVSQLLNNGALTDSNLYQCYQLITETRLIAFYRELSVFLGLFSEINQLIALVVQQRPYLVMSTKNSLNVVLVHLLASILKAGGERNTRVLNRIEQQQQQQKQQQPQQTDKKTAAPTGAMGVERIEFDKCISAFANNLKNLARHREFVPLAWPLVVQYLELSSRHATLDSVKRHLNQSIFAMFDLLRSELGQHDGLQPLFSRLNDESRALFNIMFGHYQHYHNYQGQV